MKMALLLSLGIVWLAGCKSETANGLRPSQISALNLNNRTVHPFQAPGAKGMVFLFVRTDCPISNRYAPEIERLSSKYAKEGIVFWLVYPDGSTSAKEIEQHRKEYRLTLKALRDPGHALVKAARVTVTPEAAVFLTDGKEIYHGRIDDRYVDLGKERPEPTTRELDEALKSIIEGKPVVTSATRAVGCYIE